MVDFFDTGAIQEQEFKKFHRAYKVSSASDDTLFILQLFYVGMAVFWILLVSYFRLWKEKYSFILVIPLIVFFITFLYLEDVSPAVE